MHPASFNLAMPAVKVLRVTNWLRLGNAVRQLQHVFHMGEHLEVEAIEFPAEKPFLEGTHSGKFRLAWRHSIDPPPELSHLVPPKPGIKGSFFYIEALGTEPSAKDLATVTKRHVSPLLRPLFRRRHPLVGPEDVALHFRAGDVFKSIDNIPIHPGYGQPPAAYYIAAVRRERAKRAWLVHEDRSNPAVAVVEVSASRCRHRSASSIGVA